MAAMAGLGWWRGWRGLRFALALAAGWCLGLVPALTGGDTASGLRLWAAGAVLLALVGGYTALIARLRRRAAANAETRPGVVGHRPAAASSSAPPPMSEVELDRYARHIVLRELGGPGQQRLRRARVLVVGAGALGAPVCLYLAAAGVGRITIADDDTVSLSNLQRQVLFRDADLGRPKIEAAAETMAALNPHIAVNRLGRRITEADVELVAEHDLVLDGTDSYASRAGTNRACVAARVPLVAGSIAQWEGQVTVWDPARDAPCLACLFPEAPAPGLAPSCAEAGVVGALPGVVGSVMALEAIKLIAGAGAPLRGRMLVFDGLWGETRTIALRRDPACPVCGEAVRPRSSPPPSRSPRPA
ncbi:molybdopterin-synthase adenylyltransferase MoeB [Paracoccus sp. S-4012]|nr:molybdopterin-synthase adenylyltransferase MoeB [Paracoccus sp. S-4012]